MKIIYSSILSVITQISILSTLTHIILFLFICSLLFVCVVFLIRLKDLRFNKKVDAFTLYWAPDFFNYIGSDRDPKEFTDRIPKKNASIFLLFLKKYIHSLSGKELQSLLNIINNTWIYDYLLRDLRSRSIERRLRAIYYFGIAKNQQIKPILSSFLTVRNLQIFFQSARSLARMNALETTERILAGARLQKKISQEILVSILLEFNPEVCEYLIKRIYVENEKFKTAIIKVFRNFNYGEASPILRKIINEAKDKLLIIECIKFAGQIECLNALDTIKTYLQHPDPDIRSEAVKSVKQIGGDTESLEISVNLYDNSWQVQIDAAEALVNLKPVGISILKLVSVSQAEPRAASVAQMVLSEFSLESGQNV